MIFTPLCIFLHHTNFCFNSVWDFCLGMVNIFLINIQKFNFCVLLNFNTCKGLYKHLCTQDIEQHYFPKIPWSRSYLPVTLKSSFVLFRSISQYRCSTKCLSSLLLKDFNLFPDQGSMSSTTKTFMYRFSYEQNFNFSGLNAQVYSCWVFCFVLVCLLLLLFW